MRKRLRRRVSLFFLLAAVPSLIVSAGALALIDRVIRAEIAREAADAVDAVSRGLEAETRRVERAIERLARDDGVRSLVEGLDHLAAVERAEGAASLLAAEANLAILGLIAASGPAEGTIVSSAHLSTSTGDPAPAHADPARVATATVGFAAELVAGNPPRPVPALLATERVRSKSGALVVYGGARLDVLLRMLSRTAGATLVLEVDGEPSRSFGGGGSGLERVRALSISGLAGGKASVAVAVDTSRLRALRRRFAVVAAILLGAVLLGALGAGAWLSRPITEPILELSRAAERVGAGDLEVRVARRGDDEVGELVGVFNSMVGELAAARESVARAERIAAWRDAARQVAHEIKNPLTPMRMAMETLKKAYRVKHPDLDAIVEESTQAVLDEVRALSSIVSAFSEFARLPKPRLERTTVRGLVDGAARLYGKAPEGVALETHVEGDPPDLRADPEQIGRALINLVKNAIEALDGRAGRIVLRARPEVRAGRAGARVEVADDGPGMSEEARKNLFKPYFTTKASGTGLGLAIVERIVAEHDGAIEVESATSGTTVALWIPAAGPEEPVAEA